jgi:hypothetical protein
VFRDASGAVIEYGNRWSGESPPEDTYGVTSNLERFAPLHDVADALIEHLCSTYAVTITDDLSLADKLAQKPVRVIRAAELVPERRDAVPLLFAFTSFPGVIVRAGALNEFAFPVCGCDACDDSIEAVVHYLEETVLAAAQGRYQSPPFVAPPWGFR